MRVIKRYSNRKLYDTTTKRYITLDKIAALIRDGEELQVIDNSSGDDLTTLTLSQIILEQEKKQKEFIPRSILNALIIAGGKPISSLRKRLEIPLGYLRQIDDEIERRIHILVQQGDLTEDLGKKLQNQLINNYLFSTTTPLDDEGIQRIIEEYDLPSMVDIENLVNQVDRLSKEIQEFE